MPIAGAKDAKRTQSALTAVLPCSADLSPDVRCRGVPSSTSVGSTASTAYLSE